MSADGLVWLDVETVRAIHDRVLEPGQLVGESGTRSLDAVLARVEQQVHYGQTDDDAVSIAAAYAVVIARGHVFADGNKRTALAAMAYFLAVNGYRVAIDGPAMAEIMVRVASGETSDVELYAELVEEIRTRG